MWSHGLSVVGGSRGCAVVVAWVVGSGGVGCCRPWVGCEFWVFVGHAMVDPVCMGGGLVWCGGGGDGGSVLHLLKVVILDMGMGM